MGELATRFGGKINGELIRAEDWNGLINGIEAQLTGLETRLGARIDAIAPQLAAIETRLGARIDALAPRLTAAEARLTAITQSLTPLQALAASLLDRQRRINLNATRTTFAVGERAEIVAQVTDLLGAPLNLANEAARPWVDFVATEGKLTAAPGFTNVVGTGGRSVSVQVNAAGEAKALLRAGAGEDLPEAHELEVAAVLGTNVGARNVARAFLDAPTPGSTEVASAFAAVTSAYQRTDTAIVRNYLDGVYLRNPVRSYTPLTPSFAINWRDDHVTVLAFVKPDDNPGTADGAMAVGSIRVTWRDWIYPWIMTHFMPVKPDIVGTYREQFRPKIRGGIEASVSGVWDVIETRTKDIGILGAQREFAAAQEALKGLTFAESPSYLSGVVLAVGSGLSVQRSLAYGQAVAPLLAEDVAPARGFSTGFVRGEAVAAVAVEGIMAETQRVLTTTETRIMGQVAAETTRFSNDLLKEGGPIRRAEILAQSAKFEVDKVNLSLGNMAPIAMVTQLLNAKPR
jgi:hypothetical protein